MKLKTCSFNIFFPVILDIRKHLFEFEEHFTGFQRPFNLLPLPDQAPPEIPRITSVSAHGHTQLNITSQNLQVVTNFDENFENDIDKCFEYMERKFDQALDGMKNTIGDRILFLGITTQIEFDGEKNCAQKLSEQFMNIKTELEILDVNSRVTFQRDEKYYINITVENTRTYSGMRIGNPLSLANLTQVGEGILVTLDVNDRLAFNKDDKFKSSKAEAELIFNCSKEIVKNKLRSFVEKGVF